MPTTLTPLAKGRPLNWNTFGIICLVWEYLCATKHIYTRLPASVLSSELGPPTPCSASECVLPRNQSGKFTLACGWRGVGRVSSKQTKKFFGSNRNKPKQDLFCVCSWNQNMLQNKTKQKISVSCGISNQYQNNRNKQICFVNNWNKLKQP